MTITYNNPTDLMDVLYADLLDFDPERPEECDDLNDYEDKLARLRECEEDYAKNYPRFEAQCEWCCRSFISRVVEGTQEEYSLYINRLVKRHGWVILPGVFDEKLEKETTPSSCFHKVCHEASLR